MKWWACVLLCACGAQPLPDLQIAQVTPATVRADQAGPLFITVVGVYPFLADYGRSAVTVNPSLNVRLGSALLGTFIREEGGVLSVPITAVLQPSTYDLEITASDGRTVTLTDAVQITPGIFPEGYLFDPFGDPKRDEPAAITIRATGSAAANFHGVVELTSSKGTVTPSTIGPFSNGVGTETVVFDSVGGNMTLTATDGGGKTGTSAAFRVSP